MESFRYQLGRRQALLGLAGFALGGEAWAFGQEGAFHPRVLLTGGLGWGGDRESAPSRWAWELVSRTSAPGRLTVDTVAADEGKLMHEPFAVWSGDTDIPELTVPEIRGLQTFLRLGGLLVVDDADPEGGAFGRAARRELQRVLPRTSIVALPKSHVIYKSYYLVERPIGRILGPETLEVMVPVRDVAVIFSSHDLLGALARSPEGGWAMEVQPGGARQRQLAIYLAVNIAMYVLCSDYKDDQVHAPEIMRRRGRTPQK